MLKAAPANIKVMSKYSDEQLKAYVLGFSSALGVSSPSEEEQQYLVDITKKSIAAYQATSQEKRDEWDAKVAECNGE